MVSISIEVSIYTFHTKLCYGAKSLLYGAKSLLYEVKSLLMRSYLTFGWSEMIWSDIAMEQRERVP